MQKGQKPKAFDLFGWTGLKSIDGNVMLSDPIAPQF